MSLAGRNVLMVGSHASALSIARTLVEADARAKAFPAKVRVCAVVGSSTTPTGNVGSGVGSDIARTVLFLLGEESLGSAAIVRLDADRR